MSSLIWSADGGWLRGASWPVALSGRRVALPLGAVAAIVCGPAPAGAQQVVWTQRMPTPPVPSPRQSPRLAYDSARGVTVLFGGYTGVANGAGLIRVAYEDLANGDA